MHSTFSSNAVANARRNMPMEDHPLQCLDTVATIRPYYRRQEICRPGQVANTWYRVLSGAALRSVIKSDGRRQIVDLLFPGDYFGLAIGREYDYTVEASTSGSIVAGYPREIVEALADSNRQLAREIRQLAIDELARLQQQVLILGCITAQQKVGSFIIAMTDRLSEAGSDRVTLPFSRYDIADYLAVSVETVSRALSDLQHRRLIRFIGTRVIQIVDRGALENGDDMPARRPATVRVSPQLS